MRWFNFRRFIVGLILVPFFLILLVVNNVFLLMDYILFPLFLGQKVVSPIFIIAAPRSATTYLFHSLAKDENVTYFKLWEIVFAPSICQKYLLLFVINLDRLVGHPIKRVVIFVENLLIGKLKKIHLIGLDLPEEDEAILLWSLSSFYLNFFYPDSHFFDDLALFDDKLSQKRKSRIMRSYSRYVKRHNFVFNRKSEKRYLSKNPLMMPKIGAIAKVYPDALLLNINRCPAKTIPSTLELNRKLYGIFTSRKVPKELNARTILILIEWYKMAEKNLTDYFPEQHLKIDFNKLVQQDKVEINRISSFLETKPELLQMERGATTKKHKSKNQYSELTNEQMKNVLEELPFMADCC